jgi:hypothetical protein
MLTVCESSYDIPIHQIHPFFWFVDPASDQRWRTMDGKRGVFSET